MRVFSSAAQEAGWIADRLRRAHLVGGVPWSRMAVLSRSARRALPALRRALLAAGVPIAAPPDELPLARQPAVVPLLMVLRYAARPGELDADAATALLTSPLGSADPLRMRRLRRGLLRLQAAGDPTPTAAHGAACDPAAIAAPAATGSPAAPLATAGPSSAQADSGGPASGRGDAAQLPRPTRSRDAAVDRSAGSNPVEAGVASSGDAAVDRTADRTPAEGERVGSDPLLVEALRAAAACQPDPLDALPPMRTPRCVGSARCSR